MFHAIELIKFIALIIIGPLYFFGLGRLVTAGLGFGKTLLNQNRRSIANEFALFCLIGLILNYGITLVCQELNMSFIVGGLLSLTGLFIYIMQELKQKATNQFDKNSLKQLLLAFLFCIIFLGPILIDPLVDWDARSIWFLHGKMIYYANSLGLSAGWSHSSIQFSHVDYPLFVPALTAQIMHLFGFWNESLPKMSLLFIWMPMIIWLFTFAKKSFSFLFLICVIPFSFFPWIWDGYMDGLLAAYFGLSILLFVRYMQKSESIDLLSSLICLFSLVNIKNEGQLALISGLLAFLVTFLLLRKKIVWSYKKALNWKFILIVIIVVLPSLIWIILKKRWIISNDLEIGTMNSINRLLVRLSDGSIKTIFKYFFFQLHVAVMILSLILIVFIVWKIPIPLPTFTVIIAAVAYNIGMVAVYLATPNDLVWHIQTSIPRTMLLTNGSLYIICFLLLDSLTSSFSLNNPHIISKME